jgi:hypothetical protein
MEQYMQEQEAMLKYEPVLESEEEEQAQRVHHRKLWDQYLTNVPAAPPEAPQVVQHIASCQPQKHNPAIERLKSYTLHKRKQESGCNTTAPPPSTPTKSTYARELQDWCPIAYSQIFLIPKPSDPTKLRVLGDYLKSKVNLTVRPKHFQSDNIRTLHGMINPGDKFLSWDLKSAFDQVLIHPPLRRLLRLRYRQLKTNKVIRRQSRTAIQGFKLSPYLLKKVLEAPVTLLRSLGIRLCIATDDICAVVSSNQQGMLHGWVITEFIGITLNGMFNSKKLISHLPHRLRWYGMIICSVVSVTFLPSDKVTKIVQMAMTMIAAFDRNSTITFRQLEKMKGTMIAAMDAVDTARILCIGLQETLTYLRTIPHWTRDLPIAARTVGDVPQKLLLRDLRLIVADYKQVKSPQLISWNGKYHHCGLPLATIFVDACNFQRGFTVQQDLKRNHPAMERSYPMDKKEALLHITEQEEMAGVEALEEVIETRNYQLGTIAMCVDATAGAPYLQTGGGRKAHLTERVRHLYQVLRQRRLVPLIYHIAGEINPGDKPSRAILGPKEYKLCTKVYQEFNQRWGPVQMDCFAAKWNHQHHRYITFQRTDRQAVAYDFLVQPISKIHQGVLWMFPPPHTKLLRTLFKIIKEHNLKCILILPMWAKEFIQEALTMALDIPVLLQHRPRLLNPPQAYTIHQVEHSSTTRTCKSQIGVLLQGHANCNEELPKHLLSILKSATRSRNPPQSVVDILTDHGQRFSPICPKTAVNDLRSLSQMLIFATSAPTSLRPKEQRIRTSLQ